MRKNKIIEKINLETNEKISLQQVIDLSGDQSYGLLLLSLSIPNVLFLPDFSGLPILVGVPTFIICIQYIFGRTKIFVPKKILNWKIKKKSYIKIISFIDYFRLPMRKRKVNVSFFRIITGILMCIISILSCLPIFLLPAIPSLLMVLYALSVFEEDEIFLFICNILSLPIIIFFIYFFNCLWSSQCQFF